MLSGRAANALHDPGNHVDLEPSDHAGRLTYVAKVRKRMLAKGVTHRMLDQNEDQK